ncbi:MAG: DUF899 domain-containing protein [Geminicoccaceae bacterium]
MTTKLVSREQWLEQRKALLEREKAFTRERDALTEARRALPMVAVDKAYIFETEDGSRSLADLFEGRGQLIVYHFMYGPDWTEGCPSCSFWSDHFDGLDAHLAARNTAFAMVSNAPLETLLAYRARMGWHIKWVSAGKTTFGEDFGVSFHDEAALNGTGYNYGQKPYASESPGLSVFSRLADGTIAHSYSTYGRGLDILNTAYHLLDMTPKGRDEDELPYKMAWIRRRDEYDHFAGGNDHR